MSKWRKSPPRPRRPKSGPSGFRIPAVPLFPESDRTRKAMADNFIFALKGRKA